MFKLFKKIAVHFLIKKNKRILRKYFGGIIQDLKWLEPDFENAVSLALTRREYSKIPTLDDRNNVTKGQYVIVVYNGMMLGVSIRGIETVGDEITYNGLMLSVVPGTIKFNQYSFVLVKPEHVVDIGDFESEKIELPAMQTRIRDCKRLEDLIDQFKTRQMEMLTKRHEIYRLLVKVFKHRKDHFNNFNEGCCLDQPPYCFMDRYQRRQLIRNAQEERHLAETRKALLYKRMNSAPGIKPIYKKARGAIGRK
jgi:hypothetical protein